MRRVLQRGVVGRRNALEVEPVEGEVDDGNLTQAGRTEVDLTERERLHRRELDDVGQREHLQRRHGIGRVLGREHRLPAAVDGNVGQREAAQAEPAQAEARQAEARQAEA